MHLPDQQQRTIYYPSELAKELFKDLESLQGTITPALNRELKTGVIPSMALILSSYFGVIITGSKF